SFETSGMIAGCCVMSEDAFRTAIPLGKDRDCPSKSKKKCAFRVEGRHGRADGHGCRPNSLSSSSMEGMLPRNFSGKLSASRYSEMPMGLLMSRTAYSATNHSLVLQRMM